MICSSVYLLFLMSVILQVDGLRCHYAGTAGRGQVIGSIVLVPLDEGLHKLRGDEPYFVTKTAQLARPVMRAPTCFYRHNAALTVGKERKHLGSLELQLRDLAGLGVDRVQLKEALGNVQSNNSEHGGLHGWVEPPSSSKKTWEASMPSSVYLLFLMSVILQVDGLHCHYAGTAGRGQVSYIPSKCRISDPSNSIQTLVLKPTCEHSIPFEAVRPDQEC